MRHALPAGNEISFAPEGIEEKMIEFLEGQQPVDEEAWFERVRGSTGAP